jgi:hypothetical protein
MTLAVAAGVALLALAWRSEADAHSAATAKLVVAHAQIASLSSELASTHKSLAQVQAIAKQRRAVLLQAAATLRGVDPLLSQVDRLRQAAANAQDAQTQWGNSLSDAYNYLNNNLYAIDWAYANSLVDQANNLLTQSNAADAAYANVASTFTNQADSFTQSVRNLQSQLKPVTGAK